jgi:hypothetical protein
MSGGFPIFPEIQQWTADPGTASYSSAGFRSYQAYTGTPSGTYGAWAQLIASTPFDADGLIVWLPDSASVSGGGSINIGVGAAGSEHIIIKGVILNGVNTSMHWFYAPIQVPAGSRIAFQAAEETYTAGDCIQCGVSLMGGGYGNFAGAGMEIVNSNTGVAYEGVSVAASSTVDSYGAFTQITASTGRDYLGFMVGLDDLAGTTSESGGYCQLDIAIGAAGSEQPIIFDLPFDLPYGPPTPATFGPFFFPIPAGTRISAKFACNIASNTIGVSVYGIF